MEEIFLLQRSRLKINYKTCTFGFRFNFLLENFPTLTLKYTCENREVTHEWFLFAKIYSDVNMKRKINRLRYSSHFTTFTGQRLIAFFLRCLCGHRFKTLTNNQKIITNNCYHVIAVIGSFAFQNYHAQCSEIIANFELSS